MTSRPSRSHLFVTLALAVVVGGAGGLVAGLAVGPDDRGSDGGADGTATTGESHAVPARRSRSARGSAEDRDEHRRSRAARTGGVNARTARRGGAADRAALSRRIESADPGVRYGAALDLMLAGPRRSTRCARSSPPPTKLAPT
jgi:hypothetical protein